MKPVVTLAAFTGALVLVFGAAVGVGKAVGPVGTAAADTSTAAPAGTGGMRDMGGMAGMGSAGPAAADPVPAPAGLAVSQDAYSLTLARTVQPAGSPGRVDFAITGPDGSAVTTFTPQHGSELHLLVVRRDLTGFQHLHPTRDAAGTWTVPLTLTLPGPYKVLADFLPAGRSGPLTLAADLTAPGTYAPVPAPPESRTASVAGYQLELAGDLVGSRSSRLSLNVAGGAGSVSELQAYLVQYGHLVALREGDLAYVDGHPTGTGESAFSLDAPSSARYRLFLDVPPPGVGRTAAFTITAGPSPR